ncbi:MAG: TIGR03557 family F420-dependent LLM class oxidoreductase [Anaerolineales bacterium]|nr:TIGR03557 family F420-dependent LLM class oxidoreductase [Anaerolineales bacterium]
MTKLGYALSSEEHSPNDLVRFAQRAEEVGFEFALISDHYHPWVSAQGQSPFVWSVIGGIAQVTERLELGTGVTCPIMRLHPAIIAQAAATASVMMNGRFFLSVGTGENLNEHILGEHWPPHPVRLEMMEEAVDIMRQLWEGESTTYYGDFFTVEDAQIFTLPNTPPLVMVAGSGSHAIETAGRIGDGLVSLAPKEDTIQEFRAAGGDNKPCYGQIAVCWAESEAEGKEIVSNIWPNSGITGQLNQDLRTVKHFEQAVKMLSPEQRTEHFVCGPDPQKHIEQIYKFIDAGYDHIYIHQIGHNQDGFFRFYQQEILPEFR